jgi:hypothetical protein
MKFGQGLPITPLTSANAANVAPPPSDDTNGSTRDALKEDNEPVSPEMVTASLIDVLRSGDTSDNDVNADDDIADSVEQDANYNPASDPASIADYDISTNDFEGGVDETGRYIIQPNGALSVSLAFKDRKLEIKFPTVPGRDSVEIPLVSTDGRDLTRSVPIGDLLCVLAYMTDDEMKAILERRASNDAATITDSEDDSQSS